jgi:N-acetylglutamate synthase
VANFHPIEIRPFTMEAFDRVYALWQQSEGIGLSEADSPKNIQAYLSRNPGMSFIATAGDTVIGAALCGHDGRRGYLYHLAVHPQSRRRSVGRRLVDQCLAALQREGIHKCHIFVFRENQEGIAFWKSVGWTPRSDIGLISKSIMPAAIARS